MKILVVLPYSPFPVRSGTGRLMMSLIEGLSSAHEVVLATMTFSMEESRALEGALGGRIKARPMVAPNKSGMKGKIYHRLKNAFLAFFALVPMEVSYAAPGKFLDFIRTVAVEEDVDLVLASYWHLYRLPARLPDFRNILLTHDIDFLIGPGKAALARSLPERMARRWDSFLRARIEKKAYKAFEAVLTVTERDAWALEKSGFAAGRKIRPLPLALDLARFAPPRAARDRDRILMTGTFHSDFNDDALRWFIGDVFPAVLGKRPSAVLQVVGEGVAEDIIRNSGGNIEFRGYVEDIRESLARCSLLVLPLRFAGGVRIRMMEAAAMAVPVVSTPVGVEGMGMEAGVEYQEASDATEMAGRISALLGDAGLAARTGLNARRWAERNISMSDYGERLEKLISEL